MKNCPICNKENIVTQYGSEHGLEEETIYCPDKCYRYDFSYGHTDIMVGDFMTGYSYNDDKDKIKEQLKLVDVLIEHYKIKESK